MSKYKANVACFLMCFSYVLCIILIVTESELGLAYNYFELPKLYHASVVL